MNLFSYLPRYALLICLAILPGVIQAAPHAAERPRDFVEPRGFRQQETQYYIVHTDLPQDAFRAIELRLNHIAEEYQQRTQVFSTTQDNQKMPFYLFSNQKEYEAAGALPGSSGVFDGQRLLACASDAYNINTWHIIQHEMFHQYAVMRLNGEDLPVWLNEGLAEYFGESIFTGDGLVCGLIPPYRLERLRKTIADRKALSVADLIAMSHEDWNKELTSANYDMAWALVQFLVQGDSEKHQKAFVNYIREAGKGGDALAVFQKTIGPAGVVETRFRDWLHELPEHPTKDKYAEVVVATVTSFVARAAAQKQVISDYAQLQTLAKEQNLRCSNADWLPIQLLTEVLPIGEKADWTFGGNRRGAVPVLFRLGDEIEVRGFYTLKAGRVQKVWVQSQKLKTVHAGR